MRRLMVIALLALAGCGSGTVDEEFFDGDIRSQKDPVIQTTIKAVEKGQVDGDQLMTREVNLVLQTHNVKFFYQGLSTLADNTSMNAPDTGAPAGSCPYVGPKAQTGADTGPQSCRYLAEDASEQAQIALDAIKPNSAIDSEFAKGDTANLALYRTWYTNGATSSVNVTGVLLAGTLRQAGVCDNAPSASESAYNKGLAFGRKLYIKAMNDRLQQMGIDFNYPSGSKPSQSIRYCQANLRNPAIQDAQSRVSSSMSQSPLCTSYNADPIDQSAYASQYQKVNDEYKKGIFAGISQEDAVAQSILMGSGCCIASPLVLDLGGDGIHLGGSAWFDLVGNGGKVESSWVRGDDALLVRDVDGNGRIDDVNELFGNNEQDPNGFANLAKHDGNKDGVIDSEDAIYTELRLWQDANGDGTSTSDELSTLAQMGVKAIELRYTEDGQVDQHGNQFRQTARFIRSAEFSKALGSTGTVVDVWFNYR